MGKEVSSEAAPVDPAEDEKLRTSSIPGNDVHVVEADEPGSIPEDSQESSTDVPWYADQRVRIPPDYMNDTSSWALLPGCDVPWRDLAHHRPPEVITVQGDSVCNYSETKVLAQPAEPTEPLVDCFFVHPTTYVVGRGCNQSINASQLDSGVAYTMKTQASAFDEVCAVFSPHYRQAALRMYLDQSDHGAAAFEMAYSDVKSAFQAYMSQYNRRDGQSRPLILAGHSQGSQHLIRLLKELFDPDTPEAAELRSLLVAAYPIGFAVGNDTFPNGLVKAAMGPDEVGPVFISFCTINNKKSGSAIHDLGRWVTTQAPIAHNPLSWQYNDGLLVEPEYHQGAIDKDATAIYKTARGGFVSAVATDEGVLRIDDSMFKAYMVFLEDGMGEYHSMEINLFWVNLRSNVHQRVANFLKQRELDSK